MKSTATALLICALMLGATAVASAEFRAGAAVVDVAPPRCPAHRRAGEFFHALASSTRADAAPGYWIDKTSGRARLCE